MENYKAGLRDISERINTLMKSMEPTDTKSTGRADNEPEVLVQSNKWVNDRSFVLNSESLVRTFWTEEKSNKTTTEMSVTRAADLCAVNFACYFGPPNPNDDYVRTAFDTIIKRFGGEYTFQKFQDNGMFDKLVTKIAKS